MNLISACGTENGKMKANKGHLCHLTLYVSSMVHGMEKCKVNQLITVYEKTQPIKPFKISIYVARISRLSINYALETRIQG